MRALRNLAKRPESEQVPLQIAQVVNAVWSMDFVSYSLASGRRIKYLTVPVGAGAAKQPFADPLIFSIVCF